MNSNIHNYHSRNLHLDTIKVLSPPDAQNNCFKISIKIYIKTAQQNSCFNVNSNTSFKAIILYISW
jgi:hypothetical protein